MRIAPSHAAPAPAPHGIGVGAQSLDQLVGQPLDRIVVHLSGRLVYTVLPRLRGVLRMVEQEPGLALDIDLSAVDFIDSGGVCLLLTVQHAVLQGGGSIRFAGIGARVRRVLERTRALGLMVEIGFLDAGRPAAPN